MPLTSFSRFSDAQLEVRNLHLWRGEQHLLRGISFALSTGQLLQVNGPNGVGKTSLLRIVAQLLPAESGELLWNGARVQDEFRQQLLYLGHSNALKLDLTAAENLQFSIGLQRSISRDDCVQALQTLAIPQCIDLPGRVLSAGQRRRVALARLLLAAQPIWVLDEPITNLDVSGIAAVEALLSRHLDQGGLILVAAHQPLLATHSGTRQLHLN